MIWLVLGVALWWGAHSFKRLAPGPRAAMGNAGKGAVALALVVSIVLMVIGYKAADQTYLWTIPGAMHITDLLMVFSVILFGVGQSKSRLRGKLRHPMLLGMLTWAVAHLLVNGDVPSLVLFGGLGLWTLFAMVTINRAEPPPAPFTGGSLAGDIRLIAIAFVLYVVIVLIHAWVGPAPVPGM